MKLWIDGTQGTFRDASAEDRTLIAQGIYGDTAARERAIALIDAHLAKPHEHVSQAWAFALLTMEQPARTLNLMRTHQITDTSDPFATLWGPQGRAIRALPEFGDFVREFGFVALWDRYGEPDDCRKDEKGDYICE